MKKRMYDTFHDLQSSILVRIALMECVFWFGFAFAQYQTVYLQGRGMSSSYIGTLNAIASLVAIFATTFWGMIADKINSIKKTFLMILVGSALFYGLIAVLPADFRYASIMFLIYCPFANFFKGPMNIQIDNFTVRNCAQHRINYGAVRSIGSLTFAIASLMLSAWIIPWLGVRSTFPLFSLFMILSIFIVLSIPDPRIEKRREKKKLDPKALFRNHFYLVFIIYVFFVYIAFGAEFSFFSYYLADRGIKITNLGLVLALRAVMEMPMLLIMQRLRHRFPLKYMIVFGALLIGLECLGLGLIAHKMSVILPFLMLYGLGNGVNIGTISNYLYKLAPEDLRATAHSVFGAVTALSGVIGNLAGGFVLKSVGASNFYVILGSIILSAVLFFVFTTVLYKKQPNPADEKD